MVHLPIEILREILQEVHENPRKGSIYPPNAPRSNLPALATVCKSWQAAVETITLGHVRLLSRHLETFEAVFFSPTSGARRRELLRKLSFTVELPPPLYEQGSSYATPREHTADSMVFSKHMWSLLRMLSQFPAHRDLVLYLDAHRERDDNVRYEYSYIELLPPANSETIPAVHCVRTFEAAEFFSHRTHPCAIVQLLKMFPSLEATSWHHDDPTFFLPLRRQHYNLLTRALADFRLPATMKAWLFRSRVWSTLQWKQLPDLSGIPSLCDVTRNMIGGSNLGYIEYEGLIDPSFFWSGDCSFAGSVTDTEETVLTTAALSPMDSWGHLEGLLVTFKLSSLSGQWFFEGDGRPNPDYRESSEIPLPTPSPGDDELPVHVRIERGELLPPGYNPDDPDHDRMALEHKSSMQIYQPFNRDKVLTADGFDKQYFRWVPRGQAMNPLLRALARRLLHGAPTLKHFSMDCNLGQAPMEKWLFYFCAAGEECWLAQYEVPEEMEARSTRRARVFFHTGDWRPADDILTLLRAVGTARFGEETDIVFLPKCL